MGGAAFLPGRGTGTFSSLLVGVKSGKGLKYVGRVGGGFDARERAEWHKRVEEAGAQGQSLRQPARQALRRDLALDEAASS